MSQHRVSAGAFDERANGRRSTHVVEDERLLVQIRVAGRRGVGNSVRMACATWSRYAINDTTRSNRLVVQSPAGIFLPNRSV